jgi:hypothetical protein
MNNGEQVKITLNLGAEVIAAVRGLAQKRGVTMTEVFREAISTEKYLDDAMTRGERVLIKNGRQVREIVFR